MMMAQPHGTLVLTPPGEGLELELARRLHNLRSGLEEQIIDKLAGRPQRYADLQPLLRGRNTNVLNKALHALASEGLIDPYGDPAEPKSSKYQLTTLGVAVRDAIVELRFGERVHAQLAGPRTSGASA
jgi:DNA-binding HxlR family transcriptional regulator